MSNKGTISSIIESLSKVIDAVSNPIKLIITIVIIAFCVIIFAMYQTPVESSIYPWYPFILLFLLLLVIIAVLIDKHLDRKAKSQIIKVGNKEINVAPEKTNVSALEQGSNIYSNSLLGYSFILPNEKGWATPKENSYVQYIKQILLDEIDDATIEKNVTTNSLFGKALFNAKILEIQHGENITVELNDQTSTDTIEHQILKIVKNNKSEGRVMTEEDISELRKELNQISGVSKKLSFAVKLNIMRFDKSNINLDFISNVMPNLFLSLAEGSKEPVESINVEKDSILWNTKVKLQNVLVEDEKIGSFYIYRLNRLNQNNDYIYYYTAQWSPQLPSSALTWNSIKNSFESFKIKN